jgi:type IV secretion system protein VirB9
MKRNIAVIMLFLVGTGCGMKKDVQVKYITPAAYEKPEPLVIPPEPVIEKKAGEVQKVKVEPFVPSKEPGSPVEAIKKAEEGAKEKATDDKFINAMTEYRFEEGKIYEIYIAKQRITNIIFEEGEDFVYEQMQIGESSGMHDPVRGYSGNGEKKRVNLMLRPKKEGVDTNMVIPTNKRTYYLNVKSYKNTFQTGVYWTYPEEEYRDKLSKAVDENIEKNSPGFVMNLEKGNMDYEITGAAYWKPTRVMDNGEQTCITFPESTRTREMPVLFIVSNNATNDTEMVNYSYDMKLNAYIVHRMFDTAVLKIGKEKGNEVFIYNKKSEKNKNIRHTTKRFNHAM